MPVAIIDTITTVTEVCLLQGHSMDSIADAAGTRIYSDDLISTVINNVIRFVYGNSREDIEDNIQLFAINQLSVYELNNRMHEDGLLENWSHYDTFNVQNLLMMITSIKDDESSIDIISMYRPQTLGGY